ncbi:MAG: hypothetical protein PHQ67_10285 [Fermentimonas sp.]|nr:hypothetical protein [Fermentimonas sp.]MDD4010176.1 hypothetical protein [Fermentimonas sp.]MDD4696927.1 hypothetical protein [Fermentimonas sp.]
MIFNKDNKGNEELRRLTGNYYANNDFDKISQDIILAEEELIKITGTAVYDRAKAFYDMTGEAQEAHEGKVIDAALLERVQMPIAIYATFMMYRKNDISHESSGRKFKIDPENEKIPWQWQLERDDEIQLESYYRSIDRLIDWMDEKEIEEWMNTDTKKAMSKQLIKSATMFNQYYPIDRSSRFFVMISPFVREVERKYIRPALGKELYEKYTGLVTNPALTEDEIELKEWIYPAIPLLTMSIAFRRMPLALIPFGVVRNYSSQTHTMNSSNPASIDDIFDISRDLEKQGVRAITEFKNQRAGRDVLLPLLPNNDPRNKYMKV